MSAAKEIPGAPGWWLEEWDYPGSPLSREWPPQLERRSDRNGTEVFVQIDKDGDLSIETEEETRTTYVPVVAIQALIASCAAWNTRAPAPAEGKAK